MCWWKLIFFNAVSNKYCIEENHKVNETWCSFDLNNHTMSVDIFFSPLRYRFVALDFMTTCDRNSCVQVKRCVWWRSDLMSFTQGPPYLLWLPLSLSLSFNPLLIPLSGACCYRRWKRLRSRVPPVHLQQGWCPRDCDYGNLPAARWDIQAHLKRLNLCNHG